MSQKVLLSASLSTKKLIPPAWHVLKCSFRIFTSKIHTFRWAARWKHARICPRQVAPSTQPLWVTRVIIFSVQVRGVKSVRKHFCCTSGLLHEVDFQEPRSQQSRICQKSAKKHLPSLNPTHSPMTFQVSSCFDMSEINPFTFSKFSTPHITTVLRRRKSPTCTPLFTPATWWPGQKPTWERGENQWKFSKSAGCRMVKSSNTPEHPKPSHTDHIYSHTAYFCKCQLHQ